MKASLVLDVRSGSHSAVAQLPATGLSPKLIEVH